MKKIIRKRIVLPAMAALILSVVLVSKYYCFSVKDLIGLVLIRPREFIAGQFVFGNYDNANWNMILAKKRLNEAEDNLSIKCQKKDINLLNNSVYHLEKFYFYYNLSKKNGEDVNYFFPESINYFDRIEKINHSLFEVF